jgi:hypothetical protein
LPREGLVLVARQKRRKTIMKRTSRTLLVAAAVSGLISGAAIQQGQGDPTNAVPGKVAPVKKSPKVESCAGQNDCKGIGGCKTDAHACKFQNSCKGKGGCEITEKDIQAWEKKQKADAAKAAQKEPAADASQPASK